MTIVAAIYFAYLAGLAIARQKLRPVLLSLAVLLSIFIAGMPGLVPLVYLLMGYWLPALIVRGPDARFEQRLLAIDRRLFGAEGLARFEQRTPRPILEYLELAYLLCYAVVPAGFACLVVAEAGAEAIDRFWSIVLLAAFICYGLLPWIPTRAPRAIEPSRGAARSTIRRVNIAVLDRASVQWNTFPSGHTAASMATALAVAAYLPVAGIILGVIACSIAAGSVVGRYHYAADALAGAVVAIAAYAMAIGARGL